jgi:hypothetical protein
MLSDAPSVRNVQVSSELAILIGHILHSIVHLRAPQSTLVKTPGTRDRTHWARCEQGSFKYVW